MTNALKTTVPLLCLVLAVACSDPAEGEQEGHDELEHEMENFFSILDVDGDGKVYRNELVTESMSFYNEHTGDALTGEAAGDAWFQVFDVDGDGEVTLPEYISKGLELEAQSE